MSLKLFIAICICLVMCPRKTKLQDGGSLRDDVEGSTEASKEDVQQLIETEPGFDLTNEEIEKFHIWPQGIIPYYIDDLSFDKVFRDRIRHFLEYTNSATGLLFMELPNPPIDDKSRWVFFINRRGVLECLDHPMKYFSNSGVQKIVVGYDCLSNDGGLAATVLSLVGVPPMHNAPDRHKYITVMKSNIIPDKLDLFQNLSNNEWLFHDIDYDYGSAGHYNTHKYTVNGHYTIKLQNNIQYDVGESKTFSYNDVWKIRMLYNYIKLKDSHSAKVPECNKLFLPGNDFDSYKIEGKQKLIPREKPNKYLGIEDQQLPQPDRVDGSQIEKNENSNEQEEEIKSTKNLKSSRNV